ncbi:SMa0974 family conjugal transfer regulator [Shinella sumterensis]|uniref:SMa0974 family conjugal transfer regulator n=1 Tax=Shinella sumterensis TaxID=1967501 RepID=UPI003F859807
MQIHQSLLGVIHVAEASIIDDRSEQIAAHIRTRLHDYCLSIRETQSEMRLTFDHAHAIMTRADDSLNIRLEARDLAMFCGVKMILQLAISSVISRPQEALVWRAPALLDLYERSRRQTENFVEEP